MSVKKIILRHIETQNNQESYLSEKKLETKSIMMNINPKKLYKTRINTQKRKSQNYKYETRLLLSSESWMVYDLEHKKYLRGWKPEQKNQFDGLSRLVIFNCCCYLLEIHPQYADIQIRINTVHLDRWNSSTKNDINFTLRNNTIIRFKDLIRTILITSNFDLVQHVAIHCGYLLYCYKKHLTVPMYYYLEDNDIFPYLQKIVVFCNEWLLFDQIGVRKTILNNNLELKSTVCDMCNIFLNTLKYKQFHQTISMRNLKCHIKNQVGYKYWQNKIKYFINQNPNLGQQYSCVLNYRGKNNFSVISHNIKQQIIVILQDCKFSMAKIDIKRVQNWVQKVRKPIVEKNSSKKRILSREKDIILKYKKKYHDNIIIQ